MATFTSKAEDKNMHAIKLASRDEAEDLCRRSNGVYYKLGLTGEHIFEEYDATTCRPTGKVMMYEILP